MLSVYTKTSVASRIVFFVCYAFLVLPVLPMQYKDSRELKSGQPTSIGFIEAVKVRVRQDPSYTPQKQNNSFKFDLNFPMKHHSKHAKGAHSSICRVLVLHSVGIRHWNKLENFLLQLID